MTMKRWDKRREIKCPKCGSIKTKMDWSKGDNYRWGVVRGVLTAVAGMSLGGGFDRICKDCGHKFEG
jgi:hypothetical protein